MFSNIRQIIWTTKHGSVEDTPLVHLFAVSSFKFSHLLSDPEYRELRKRYDYNIYVMGWLNHQCIQFMFKARLCLKEEEEKVDNFVLLRLQP